MRFVEVRAGTTDPTALATFRCSTGAPFEDEVQTWIRDHSLAWVNDVPRARFQRRALHLVEEDSTCIGVVAWQDIARIDVDGIWLEVLALDVDHQGAGVGSRLLDATTDHLRGIDRDGDHLAGLVHPDNTRCQQLLSSAGWQCIAAPDGHQLWIASR